MAGKNVLDADIPDLDIPDAPFPPPRSEADPKAVEHSLPDASSDDPESPRRNHGGKFPQSRLPVPKIRIHPPTPQLPPTVPEAASDTRKDSAQDFPFDPQLLIPAPPQISKPSSTPSDGHDDSPPAIDHITLSPKAPKPESLRTFLDDILDNASKDPDAVSMADTRRLVAYWRRGQYGEAGGPGLAAHCGALLGWATAFAAGPESEPLMTRIAAAQFDTPSWVDADNLGRACVGVWRILADIRIRPSFTYGFAALAFTPQQRSVMDLLGDSVRLFLRRRRRRPRMMGADAGAGTGPPRFPFFAQKWIGDGQSRAEAELEMAMAGTAMSALLHQFFCEDAPMNLYNCEDSSSFTMVVSPEVARLFVHWSVQDGAKDVRFYHDQVFACLMDDVKQVHQMRLLLDNIKDWKRQVLLGCLQEALDLIYQGNEEVVDLDEVQETVEGVVESIEGKEDEDPMEAKSSAREAYERRRAEAGEYLEVIRRELPMDAQDLEKALEEQMMVDAEKAAREEHEEGEVTETVQVDAEEEPLTEKEKWRRIREGKTPMDPDQEPPDYARSDEEESDYETEWDPLVHPTPEELDYEKEWNPFRPPRPKRSEESEESKESKESKESSDWQKDQRQHEEPSERQVRQSSTGPSGPYVDRPPTQEERERVYFGRAIDEMDAVEKERVEKMLVEWLKDPEDVDKAWISSRETGSHDRPVPRGRAREKSNGLPRDGSQTPTGSNRHSGEEVDIEHDDGPSEKPPPHSSVDATDVVVSPKAQTSGQAVPESDLEQELGQTKAVMKVQEQAATPVPRARSSKTTTPSTRVLRSASRSSSSSLTNSKKKTREPSANSASWHEGDEKTQRGRSEKVQRQVHRRRTKEHRRYSSKDLDDFEVEAGGPNLDSGGSSK
ncbi:uncharacterized protein BKCO1_4000173 [Diplodia corticola]|uniref:DUF7924 domain-containing protein n=1 Tax=Diplodia corticola TaxID=236234 RepID=A0A1J9RDV7_9PEZI|nr:uncharacterized protein BKCO1_4000173 [Diplodia corticola]OJD38625.1 hypothetical protein BKCO1_4000173 [Diplodia corticola]